jgi:AcrR family transcriptional regulator
MRTKLSREDQVQRNRDLVLAAARRVFLARGYVNATVDAIAEDAGFSKGVVYSQFESKADMFLALLEARIVQRQARNEQLAARLDGRDLAVAVTELAQAMRRTEPEWTQLVLEFRVHAARVPELSRRYAALHESTIANLASVIARLHDGAGTTPRYPVRVLAQMGLSIDIGTFLEELASPPAADLPFPDVMSELILQTAQTPADVNQTADRGEL